MIKLIKPKFWDFKNANLIAILLFPISILIFFVILIKKKFSKIKKFNIPIICVGNIYIGGTGKTPTSISIAKELLNFGKKPVILRKYYKDHIDEYNLIKNSSSDLLIEKKRDLGIIKAENKGFKTVILDDGLQDYSIKKNLSIVCFNQNQKTGNGLIIPSGPLRESLSALKEIDVVLINGRKDEKFEKKLFEINRKLEIYYSYYKPLNINKFKNFKLLAIAGIANPENFFSLLERYNLKIERKLIFPDHYMFTKIEIQNIVEEANNKKLKIIMTEKDFCKMKDFNFKELDYLNVSLVIENNEKFFEKIKSIYD